jgi:hypothetical protein
MRQLGHLLLVGLFVGAGSWIVGSTAVGPELPGYRAWASLSMGVAGASGGVLVYALNRWKELATIRRIRLITVFPAVVAAGAAVIVLSLLQGAILGRPTSSSFAWRGAALVLLMMFGSIPVAFVTYGVRVAARAGRGANTLGASDEIACLVSLRLLLQRVLAAEGSLVALSTLALGASAQLSNQLPERLASERLTYTSEDILIFGGFGSLLVAMLYVPAVAALREAGLDLYHRLFPRDTSDTAANAEQVVALAEKAQKLRELLGTDRGTFVELQTGLVIAGPLLAAATAAFLPRP